MKIRRPSGLTLVTCALLVLLPALAVLQYRWLGQVSAAERERMQRNLRNAAAQFRDVFDTEISRALSMLQVGPRTAQSGSSELYSDRYDSWLNTVAHPQIVSAIYVVDADEGAPGTVRLRRWNSSTHVFEQTAWQERLARWEPAFTQALRDSTSRGFDRRMPIVDDETLILTPLRGVFRQGGPGAGGSSEPPPFGFTILQLDTAYLREQMIPEFAQRYFSPSDPEGYRVAVVSQANTQQVLYRSDPDAPLVVDQADATISLFGPATRLLARGGAGALGPANLAPLVVVRGSDDPPAAGAVEDIGRWRLLARHRSGSLEAAVARLRYRNMALSFVAFLVLSGSVALLTVTSRRAQRLAQQQMEFVAGVSHELRTPVAVIRSAGENLSQGVVGSPERVKRYGKMIESESRRLGEMVERVLQYAGLESGLGIAARVPVEAETIVEEAIDSAVTLVGPDEVTIERQIAENLPPVIGDAAALRSAVQNLIANAVKYGGPDRWVGVRAEHARGRRHGEIRITITDHGPGIPPAELPHIFEPFYRGADAVARQIHGNGLGLSLVKQIVTAHGGQVSVSTRAGAGSTFTIALPAAEPDAQPSAVTNVRATAHS